MTTLRLLFMALLLSLLTEMPVPERSPDSGYGVAQSADVPSEVRGG